MSASYIVRARHTTCRRRATHIAITVAGNIVERIEYQVPLNDVQSTDTTDYTTTGRYTRHSTHRAMDSTEFDVTPNSPSLYVVIAASGSLNVLLIITIMIAAVLVRKHIQRKDTGKY